MIMIMGEPSPVRLWKWEKERKRERKVLNLAVARRPVVRCPSSSVLSKKLLHHRPALLPNLHLQRPPLRITVLSSSFARHPSPGRRCFFSSREEHFHCSSAIRVSVTPHDRKA